MIIIKKGNDFLIKYTLIPTLWFGIIIKVIRTVFFKNRNKLSLLAMSKEIKEHYSDWLNSSDAVDLLKKNIVKVGYPLEIYVKNILRQKGYTACNSFYEQLSNKKDDKILREIDIFAVKILQRYFHGCLFNFRLLIVGDCKYSSTNDFFAFKSDEKIVDSFPIMFNFKNIFNKENNEFFSFPLVIDKIAEIDVRNNKYHKDNLFFSYFKI